MDGDGFYLGELLNGIRGLVPSNFIQTAAMPFRMPETSNGSVSAEGLL
jgi:hypothetical protein